MKDIKKKERCRTILPNIAERKALTLLDKDFVLTANNTKVQLGGHGRFCKTACAAGGCARVAPRKKLRQMPVLLLEWNVGVMQSVRNDNTKQSLPIFCGNKP